MITPSILLTAAWKMIEEDYEAAIYAGPTYITNAFWKFEHRQSVCKFSSENYISFLTNCNSKKFKWIWQSCHKSMVNKSISMLTQFNNLNLCGRYNELEILCPIELISISKLVPFMFVVA